MTKNRYMIMKTRYFKLVTVCLLAVSLFASCLGDLATLPLDDNELTGEMVYSTPEGYIGIGHCALGYTDAPAPAAKTPKADHVLYD